MRQTAFLLILSCLIAASAPAIGQSDTIAYWAQNDNNLPGGGFGLTPASFPQAADAGALSSEATLELIDFDESTSGADNAYDCIQSFGGTSTNAIGGFDSGGSLSPQGCTGESNNGMAIELTVSTAGFENLELSWAQRGTSTGFNSRQLSYSTDGGSNFTDFGTDTGALGSSWAVQSYDLSAIDALNDNETVVFRITLDGATSSSGNNRFDNIRIDGDPVATLIGKSGPEFALAGETLTYQITVTNPSEALDLMEIEVTDTLPADLSYVSDTSSVTPANPETGVYVWSLPDTLGPQQSLSFDLTVAADAGITGSDTRTNQVSLSAQQDAQEVTAEAEWTTTFPELVTIQTIQTVANPDVDDASPLLGQTVATEGIVTAAPGELIGADTIVIQDSNGGAFSGLVVTSDFDQLVLTRGDAVRVIGEVTEPNGLTELVAESVELLAARGGAPTPELLTTADFAEDSAAVSEQWEAVLIEFNDVTVTADLNFGEWQFDDGSGTARGDDGGSITIEPALDDEYAFLRGIGWFSFGDYKLQPRDNPDIGIQLDLFEIAEIQGEGLRSPLAPPSGNDPGEVVRTEDNIVTALAGNGFFIQTPPERDSDSLPLASRGLFVFTGSAPTVAVGDRVNVTGPVVEFFGFTQIANPDSIEVRVELLGRGSDLPPPVVFDASTPSPDPAAPSCGINNFECFEGMLVTTNAGFITAPNQTFGSDPVAEAIVTTNGERALRGPGVEFPGLGGACPACPVWSGAPEIFEIDFDRLGLDNATVAAGTTFTATGVIGYEFGDYEIWPSAYVLSNVPDLPVSVPAALPEELTIGSLNALDFFDTEQDGPRPIPACDAGYIAEDREVLSADDYDLKLNKLAETIIQGLLLPDVLALQEVESLDTLQDLADRIAALTADAVIYTPYLVFGNDRGNINNGFLVNEARVAVDAVTQLGADECLSLDDTPLHDRPPLQLEARFIGDGGDWPFVVMNNHLRSLGGIDDEARVRLKRHEQAQSVAARVQTLQDADPRLPIVLVGDKNAFQFSDGYVDVVGLISGTANPDENFVNIENASVPGFNPDNLVTPPLVNPIESLPEGERYSFIFQGVSQALDHALVNGWAERFLVDFGYMRGNADYWRGFEDDDTTVARSSDHDGLVLILEPGRDVDAIFGDRFE